MNSFYSFHAKKLNRWMIARGTVKWSLLFNMSLFIGQIRPSKWILYIWMVQLIKVFMSFDCTPFYCWKYLDKINLLKIYILVDHHIWLELGRMHCPKVAMQPTLLRVHCILKGKKLINKAFLAVPYFFLSHKFSSHGLSYMIY